MGTLTEEIFSHKLGRPVEQGETVVVDVDHVMSHDTTTPLAIQAFRQLTQQQGGHVFDSRRIDLRPFQHCPHDGGAHCLSRDRSQAPSKCPNGRA